MDATSDPTLKRLVGRVQAASQSSTPLEIRGGGSKRFYGEATQGDVLDVGDFRGISSYEPTELVVTARAGTNLRELEATLAERSQCLAFEPPHFGTESSTVGGMIAAGLAGPARASVGAVRDFVLGASLLNGRGEVLTFGGQVMKNVAGYDVSRSLAGSLGILGVICEVSLKVLPIAPATRTLTFALDERAAFKQISDWALEALPINATAWHDNCLFVRLRGADSAVNAALKRVGGEVKDESEAQQFWSDVCDHRHPFFAGGALDPGESLWRLSVPRTAPPLELLGRQFIEWNGALRWWRTQTPASQLREAAARVGGHATLFYSHDKSPGVFTPLKPPLDRIHRDLKQAFDPARIFNRGRMYKEL